MSNYLQDAFNNAAILVLVAVLALRGRALWRGRREPTTRVIALLLLVALAVHLAGNIRVYTAVDRLTGIPHVGQLALDCLGLTLAWTIQVWVQHWSFPPERARRQSLRRLWPLLAALGLLVAFFALAPIDREVPLFVETYGRVAWMPGYYAVAGLYFGFTQVDLLRTSLRYRSQVEDPVVRLSLRLISLGAAMGLLYVLNKALFTVATRVGVAPPWPNQLGNRITQAGLFYLVLLGATASWWAPRLFLFRRYRQLRPLWLTLHRAFPEIALEWQPSPLWTLLRPGRLRYRVARMVTEIHDGLRRLRPHLPAPLVDAPPPAAAASLLEALRRRQAGLPAQSRPPESGSGLSTWDEEVAWLARVSSEAGVSG